MPGTAWSCDADVDGREPTRKVTGMNATAIAALNHPRTRNSFRSAKLLASGYFGISVLTELAIVLLRDNASIVTSAVWVRATIVVLSSLLTFLFTVRAARGSRRAYLRLRLLSAVMVVAIVVIIALPGTFPVWLKIEQGVCGLVLLGIVAIVNGRHVRSLFTAPQAERG
jgi:hypothetical protein